MRITKDGIQQLRVAAESVHIPLAVDFGDDLSIVIVSQRSAQFVVVHVLSVFLMTPPNSDNIWLKESKFIFALIGRPFYDVSLVLQDSIEKLPQLHVAFSCDSKEEYVLLSPPNSYC